MALIIDTSTLTPESVRALPATQARDIYCGLDSCVTKEVFDEVSPQLRNVHRNIYSFEKDLQAPALDMMLRGFRVDIAERDFVLQELEKQRARIQSILNAYSRAVWGMDLNPNSHEQLKAFFYQHMGIPEKVTRVKGEYKTQMNREVLEYLQNYFYARPIVLCILALREISKQAGVLRSGVDPDRRMRTSYNVGGTETGRWSSSKNVFGGGTNLQNITDELRRVFIADPGWKLGYFDLEQAESRVVGLLVYDKTGDPSYLDACESGDLHTTTAKLVWPNLPWTGDLKRDKEIAEQLFYRHFTHRDMSKRGGHATNYYGSDYTVARHLKVERQIITDFQSAYFHAFPGIPQWHIWVARELQLTGELTTLFGRHRQFWGRRYDDTTLREAIAYEPQSVVGDVLNSAMLNIWRTLRHRVQLLAQIHDAVVVQYRKEEEKEIIPLVTAAMRFPITAKDRTIVIPVEAKVGWNWGKRSVSKEGVVTNPWGLAKWSGHDERSAPPTAILDRVFHGVQCLPPFSPAVP